MKKWLGWLGRIYMLLSVAAFTLVVIAAAAVPAAMRDVMAVLRGEPPRVTDSGLTRQEEEFRRRVQEFESSREKRDAELRRLELVARSTLVRAEVERASAEAAKRDAEALAAASRQPSAQRREFDAQMELLARMEPASATAIMKTWTDAQVGSALKAMRPSRGAEIVDAMRVDPVWQERLPRIFAPQEGKP